MPKEEELKAMEEVIRKARSESWRNRRADAVDEFNYPGQKWEHKLADISDSDSTAEDELAMYGAQGWELVTIDFATRTAYFKRKAIGPQEN